MQELDNKILNLNTPFEGDLAEYNGIIWIYYQGKWYTLEETKSWIFEIQKDD